MINWLRKHHFLHDWGKWIIQKNGNVTVGDMYIRFYNERRQCKRCGKIEIQGVVKNENI